jgi:hypothetical protein
LLPLTVFFDNNTHIILKVRSSYKKDLKRDLFYNKVLQLLEDGTSSSEMLVKMDPPVERRRGFNEAYAGAEGSRIKALVAVGAVSQLGRHTPATER